MRSHPYRFTGPTVWINGFRYLELTYDLAAKMRAYCEIPGNRGVRIRKARGRDDFRWVTRSQTPGLERGSTRRYPLLTSTTCSKLAFSKDDLGTPLRSSSVLCPLQTPTTVDNRWVHWGCLRYEHYKVHWEMATSSFLNPVSSNNISYQNIFITTLIII